MGLPRSHVEMWRRDVACISAVPTRDTTNAAASVLHALGKMQEAQQVASLYENTVLEGGDLSQCYEAETVMGGRFAPAAINAKRRWATPSLSP